MEIQAVEWASGIPLREKNKTKLLGTLEYKCLISSCSHLARVFAVLSGAKHGVLDLPGELAVVGGAVLVVPHADVDLLQQAGGGTTEVDGSPAWKKNESLSN